MNRIVIRSITTLTFLVFATSLASLMAQSEEQVKRFKKEKETYYNEKLELSPKEAEAFWTVYNDFHNRKIKIVEEEKNAFKYAHDNSENLSNEEITEILGNIRTLKKDRFELEAEYYQHKFPKILSPKKVLKLYKVEWDFRKHLIRKLRNQAHDDRDKKGGRQGSGPGRPQGGTHGGTHGMESPSLVP